jgi:hydrogenase maturation protease
VSGTVSRVLVAGVGNVFFGDDGFGVAVAQRLATRALPPGVSVADIGIRGVHLAFELLDGYDLVVLVDAMPMGEPPGTLSVLEARADDAPVAPDAHGLDPRTVLALLGSLGGSVGRILVVGCEPATVAPGMGLSAPVAAAVDTAVDLVERLVVAVAVQAGEEARCSDD